jgi:hypothetical protein
MPTDDLSDRLKAARAKHADRYAELVDALSRLCDASGLPPIGQALALEETKLGTITEMRAVRP